MRPYLPRRPRIASHAASVRMLVSSISYTNILGAAVVGTAVVVGATAGTAAARPLGCRVGAADAVGCGDHASKFETLSTTQPLLQGASLSPQLAVVE